MSELLLEVNGDDFFDPLSVEVGANGDIIPAEGWPKEFNQKIIRRILDYLPEE